MTHASQAPALRSDDDRTGNINVSTDVAVTEPAPLASSVNSIPVARVLRHFREDSAMTLLFNLMTPVSNDSSSGRDTRVSTGTLMNGACAP